MEYTGIITKIRFYSEETKYIVALFDAQEEDKPFVITGYMSYINPDDKYKISGDYVTHPRYGKQFQFDSYVVVLADDREEMIRYLSSPLFKGIGPKQAALIVETLGSDALTQIKEDPGCLDFIKGMTAKKKETIVDVLRNQDYDQEVFSFFMGHGISTRYLTAIRNSYQEKTLEILQNNPYQLIDDIDGIGFKTADALAMKIGIDHFDPHRIQAALNYSLKDYCFKTGSTYSSLEQIEASFRRMLPEAGYEAFEEALSQSLYEHKIIVDQERYYPRDLYESEDIIAASFKHLSRQEDDLIDTALIDRKIDEIEKVRGITYDEIQRNAIHQFMEHPVMILTGGPGTGKTTIVEAILSIYRSLHPDDIIDLAAPTGRAAKRLSELTGFEAVTIHRLLKWDLTTNTFAVNEEFPLDTRLLIVDEFSMVDSVLMAQLLKGARRIKKLLLIGDDEQLPSVSPGNVLHDLMEANMICSVKLSTIYRQSDGSGIIALAHQIRNNSYDPSVFEAYKDIHFMSCDAYSIIAQVKRIITKAIEQGYDEQDIQVLAPIYNGVAGIDALNEALQELFNPDHPRQMSLKSGRRIFKEGDKILQLKNRPDDNVFNGDVGTLAEIIPADGHTYLEESIVCEFDGHDVTYGRSEFHTITHAYAMSIHKSQGNEFKIVIMICVNDYPLMMRRPLVYTGLTRAKQSLFILGSQEVFQKALSRGGSSMRHSSLKERLLKEDALISDFM